jgi:hypothetical protein
MISRFTALEDTCAVSNSTSLRVIAAYPRLPFWAS